MKKLLALLLVAMGGCGGSIFRVDPFEGAKEVCERWDGYYCNSDPTFDSCIRFADISSPIQDDFDAGFSRQVSRDKAVDTCADTFQSDAQEVFCNRCLDAIADVIYDGN